MDEVGRLLLSALLVGSLIPEPILGDLCRNAVTDGGISFPEKSCIISKETFSNKVAGGGLWYSFLSGINPSNEVTNLYLKAEALIEEPDNTTVEVTYTKFNEILIGEPCAYNDSSTLSSVDDNLPQFKTDQEYIAFISSNPDSYVWLYRCTLSLKGNSRCLTEATFIELLTRQNGPDNFNYELAGADLRESTCLQTIEYPDQYRFVFTQGISKLFLFCSERDFMLFLSKNNQADFIEAFNFTSRNLDDVL